MRNCSMASEKDHANIKGLIAKVQSGLSSLLYVVCLFADFFGKFG